MKKIRDLLSINSDIVITGITDDSRLVEPGYLFVATKGYHVDHYDYISDAIKRGCSFVVCDHEIDFPIPHFVVSDIFPLYIDLCKKFYDVSTDDFSFIGITGTDGKTTTTTIIKELLKDCAYVGTNGVSVGKKEIHTNNTTPCISELYQDLSIICKEDYHTVSMEVSSEALLHDRVHGIFYDTIGFTNVTGDHLNVHKTFENYVQCKMKLLDYVKKDGYVVYNGDDEILKEIKHPNSISFGFSKENDYIIQDVCYKLRETIITLSYQNYLWVIHSPFIGKYNVYNVVMAFIIGRIYHIEDEVLLKRIMELTPIKGRCEFLDFGQNFDLVLDYAHTTFGISSILDTFKDYENIIVVTGCAGGREKEKRRAIGKLILEKSDIAVFTMDDPRYEDVDDIIDQMVGDDKDYYRIVDREDAINYALSIASPGSVVLILGKGRDDYMAIKDKKIHYSDYEVISHYFQKS